MALDYDTGVGYSQVTKGQPSAATTSSFLTPSVWNKILHEQVQNKMFWKSMIGKDKGGEGSIMGNVANYPIVEKTDLKKDSGDTIVIGLLKGFRFADETTITYMNYGKTGSTQLVDNEGSLTFYYLHVPVALYRDGVLIQGGITKQRSPYDLISLGSGAVSTQLSKYLDDGIFTTFYAGYSPNVWRQQSLTGVAHPNNLYGKNKTALTGVDTGDTVDADMLERLGVFVKVNNIAPVTFEGEECHGLIVHPYGMKTLRADTTIVDAWMHALPSSKGNPIFTRANGQKYAGIYVMEDNRISTAKDYAVAASSDAIGTISASTVDASMSASDIRMNILIGSNSIARGWAQETALARRKEDDYGLLNGFAGIVIYGDRRADYALAQSATTTLVNQSSALLWSYSPNPNSNISAIWS